MEFRKYGTDPEMDKLVDSKVSFDRLEAAQQGYALDELVGDTNAWVRMAVAEQGRPQDLKALENDSDFTVKAVVRNYKETHPEWSDTYNEEYTKYGTDEKMDALVDSLDWKVRAEAVKQRYGLDVLVYDENPNIRIMVAELGIVDLLNELVEDEHYAVRREVAAFGRKEHLSVLLKDNDPDVKRAVERRLEKDDIEVLALLNDEKQGHLKDLDAPDERVAVAEQGRPQDLDLLVRCENPEVRLAVAKHGRPQDLDVLVYDSSPDVRAVVAGFGRREDLIVLVNDDNKAIRDIVREYKEKHPDWNKTKDVVKKDKRFEIADN